MDLTPAEKIGSETYARWLAMPNRGAYVQSFVGAAARDAYQAGREDAARAAELVFPTSTDTMRAFLARHRLSDTPSVGAVSVALLADVREAISLGRSAGGVGDNPEEQRP